MTPIKVLVVDDSEQDAALVLRELRKAGYAPVTHKRVQSAAEMSAALDDGAWDIVLCDYVMPNFSGMAALELLHGKGLDIPFIIVSGQIGEDVAVEVMKAGAHDYILKGNLKRLGPAVQREIHDARVRQEGREKEAELRAKEEELRLTLKVDALKDEFISMVSHEIKTPLPVIIGSLSVAIMEGVSREEALSLIKSAIDHAEILAGMVENLLDLSRSQAKRLLLEKEPLNIEQVMCAIADRLRGKSTLHRLNVEAPAGLPRVSVDRIRLERVLHNLVDNAIKYSPMGGEVRLCARYEDNQMVVTVSDQGMGISPENQARLFHSFERLETDAKVNIPGIGLGLNVCRILVEAHDGHIWVESELGRGAKFCFTIPLGVV
ncbi:MAG: response regulator [Chloroflexi bacterium]|nr:response regulator [Chloroflexota bacterium]